MRTSVHLLGRARAERDGQVTSFMPNKRHQLLAYLAYRSDWVDREQLAALFWPDHAPQTARSNLRQLLVRVRTLACAGDLEVERQRVRWKVRTDVVSFTGAAAGEAWREALTHYGGDLMDRLDGDEPGEFADWLTHERERLRGLRRTVLLRRAEELDGGGAHLEAAELLEELLADDEPDEVALRALVKAQRQAGDHAGARRDYRRFVERLRAEFGLGPTAELEHLGQGLEDTAVRSGAELPTSRPGPATPAGLLPTALTSFVGRDLELAEIQRLLARPECRLLTLVGPGGIGKTRLALEVARVQEQEDPGSTLFVPLDALAPGTDLATSLADRLGLSRSGQEGALETVIRHLGTRRRLLVLDNFEHLRDGAATLPELLGRCPDLRLLVTSRERLGVAGEWLFPVTGLDYPTAADLGPTHSRYFDAVRLFVERAGRVRPDFAVRDGDLPHLLAICRLVEGSPLGLELAAVWVRVLPLEDIAREIAANLDFLSSEDSGGAGRHHSLRAVFESSWRRLTPDERQAFRQLAVFRGGFRLEAARRVTGVSLPVLAALVDKSLLRLSPRGRYDRHALLSQYAAELLAEDPEELGQVEERHAQYYLAWMVEWSQELKGPGGEAARAVLDEEFGNILVAWHWGIEQARFEDLRRASTMALYFDRNHRYREGLAFYARATRALTGHGAAHGPVLGDLLLREAWFHMRLGHYEEARAVGERAMTLSLPSGASAQRGENFLGALAHLRGDFPEAVRHHEVALALRVREGYASADGRAADLHNLASLQTTLGRLDEAGRNLDQVEGLGPSLSQPHAAIQLLLARGYLFLTAGRLGEARAVLERGLAISREEASESFVSYLLWNLATVVCEQGAYEEAGHLGEQALALGRANGDATMQSAALDVLGRAAAALGRDQEARDYLAGGLQLAWSIRETPQVLEGLTYLAEGRVLRGWAGEAAPLLELVLRHPGAYHRLKVLADRMLEVLRSRLSPDEFAGAGAQGVPERLEVLVTEGLTSLGSPLSGKRHV